MRGAGRLARRALPGAVALAAAAACAPATVWERPGTSERQAETDRTECAAVADDQRYVLRYRTVVRGGQADQVLVSEPERRFDVERYEACLRSRDYRPVPRPESSPAASPPGPRRLDRASAPPYRTVSATKRVRPRSRRLMAHRLARHRLTVTGA